MPARADNAAIEAIRSSRSYQWCERARIVLLASVANSTTARCFRRLTAQWTARPWQERRLIAGVVLLVAAVTHLVLQTAATPVIGFVWLVIPAIAACIGAISLTTALMFRKHDG